MTRAPPRRRWVLGIALAATLAATLWVSQDGGIESEAGAAAGALPAGPRLPSRRDPAMEPDELRLGKLTRRAATDPTQNAFANRTWTVPAPAERQAPPAPSAPPMPFTYLGKMQEGDTGAITVYLVQGEQAYSVRKGDMIDNTWRVESINADQMVLTYLPMATRQTISFGNS